MVPTCPAIQHRVIRAPRRYDTRAALSVNKFNSENDSTTRRATMDSIGAVFGSFVAAAGMAGRFLLGGAV